MDVGEQREVFGAPEQLPTSLIEMRITGQGLRWQVQRTARDRHEAALSGLFHASYIVTISAAAAFVLA